MYMYILIYSCCLSARKRTYGSRLPVCNAGAISYCLQPGRRSSCSLVDRSVLNIFTSVSDSGLHLLPVCDLRDGLRFLLLAESEMLDNYIIYGSNIFTVAENKSPEAQVSLYRYKLSAILVRHCWLLPLDQFYIQAGLCSKLPPPPFIYP